jgi:hypothetical protein
MLSLTMRVAFASLVLGTGLAFGQADPPTVLYHLDDGTEYVVGCYPPCKCPLLLHENLVGTFGLTLTGSTPDGFEHYTLSDIAWTLDGVEDITGTGQYDIGGEVALQHRLQLDLSLGGGPVQHYDSGLVVGGSDFPTIDVAAGMNGFVCYDEVFYVVASPGPRAPTPRPFCEASDGSLASCPCGNPGNPDTGCDIAQGTGGVSLTVLDQDLVLARATLEAAGFPVMGSAASVLIRSDALEGAPVVFGDGLRCVSTSSLVRLAATTASGGVATHVFGHGAMAGPGDFYYQAWFRNTPVSFCDPLAGFNLSSGETLTWP